MGQNFTQLRSFFANRRKRANRAPLDTTYDSHAQLLQRLTLRQNGMSCYLTNQALSQKVERCAKQILHQGQAFAPLMKKRVSYTYRYVCLPT
jgi:hypothetical protein